MRWVLAILACGALGGCGYVGDPKPPTLDIPSRVTDFRAAEYGDRILVQFTLPPLTTEGMMLTGVRSVDLRVQADGAERSLPIPPHDPGTFDFEFPAAGWIGKQVTLAVSATGPKGKSSEWSNPAALGVAAPLPTPRNLQAVNSPNGVLLTWQADGANFRIFRGPPSQMPVRLAESSKPEYVDTTAEKGSPYKYFVQTIDGDFRQSEISVVVEITPVDQFPPAVPNGLSAVAGPASIELAWERNTEADFSGYNVYRAAADGAFERIAGSLDSPTFSDRTIQSGTRYRYAVTSVDITGNESARSMIVDAVAP